MLINLLFIAGPLVIYIAILSTSYILEKGLGFHFIFHFLKIKKPINEVRGFSDLLSLLFLFIAIINLIWHKFIKEDTLDGFNWIFWIIGTIIPVLVFHYLFQRYQHYLIKTNKTIIDPRNEEYQKLKKEKTKSCNINQGPEKLATWSCPRCNYINPNEIYKCKKCQFPLM